jgi:MYXO-CTERM domain-containing protein
MLFYDGFEGVTAPASLEGAATGTGIFAAPWDVQNDDLGLNGDGSPVDGYNIRNTTPLTGASGNYATGGDAYQGSARSLDRAAAIAINPALANTSGSREVIGGGGLTLDFSGVVRRDQSQQSIRLGVGSGFFGGATTGSNNFGFGFGDSDENGFIDVFSRGQVFNSTVQLVNGTSYFISVQAAFAPEGTAANLTLSIDGVAAGVLPTLDATFSELAFYGQNGANRTSVDNLSLAIVPEPGSLVLGVIGVLGIAARRRRSNS